MRTTAPTAQQALQLLTSGRRADRLLHVHRVPPRDGEHAAWPQWTPGALVERCGAVGIATPWSHQVAAAELAHARQHVVLATGTASGKSLGYQLPVLADVLAGTAAPNARGATALYLSPTKALAHDQLRALRALAPDGVRVAAYDGDTDSEERPWVRAHAHVVLSNPDLLHHSLLPGHHAWSGFLRALTYVVVDECHAYRGVFGSHVANVLRRLRRLCAHHGSAPTFVLASATSGDPQNSAARLVGVPVTAVTHDGSPHGATVFGLWEPPLLPGGGEHDAPTRRTALAESADLLTDLVVAGVRTVAFTRSRRGAESVAATTRARLAEVDAEEGTDLAGRVAAYRAGYLPSERRDLESALRDGQLLGMSATNALELGIDVSGLDAVLLAGWPGTRAALWQQAGRAGRGGRDALAVLVARDDPLDTYLVHHPEAIFGPSLEQTVTDPANPYVVAPHLAAAAAELPLTVADLEGFGPHARDVLDLLVAQGQLRARPGGWYWTRRERASDLADLRGAGSPVRIVETGTGRLLGTVDSAAAHSTVHDGAVYLHQGETYIVDCLDLTELTAHVHAADADHVTTAREVTDLSVLGRRRAQVWGRVTVELGTVEVTTQVTSYLRRDTLTGRVLDERPLHLPARTLRTTAVWWTVLADVVGEVLGSRDVPGAVHAAEHASIGLLPLVATCDRWDVGGVSSALHPDTGGCTSFVYDGHPGGAGFADRGFAAAATWLRATRDAIAWCGCRSGCPSCIQSPKCGNGNEPLDKQGAVRLLTAVLRDAGPDRPGPGG